MLESLGPTLASTLIAVARIVGWLAVLVVIFVPLERLFAVHPRRVFRKEIGIDLGYFIVSSVLPAILLGVPIALLAWAARLAVPGWFLATVAAWPLWVKVVVGIVAGEVGYYWGHRWCHEIPFLWRFHAIHHAAEEVDFLVNTRAHPIDVVFGRLCSLAPLYVLGLGGPSGLEGSQVPALVTLIGSLWGFFIHANIRWRFGPLEWLIATPAFHHWHHTLSGPIDRNYSSTLPWLDWIFGSLYLPKEWPEDYGIKAKLPGTLAGQLAYPLTRGSEAGAAVEVGAEGQGRASEDGPEPVASPMTEVA